MATRVQRFAIPAIRKKDNARTRALKQCPQARGWVNRVTIVTPRKPNSAKRPVVKVFLKKMGRLTAHIPGIGHTLKKYGKILVRGRGPRDLPGVRYSGVRGVLDFIGLKKKKRRRSIYGAEQNNLSKIRARRKYRIAIRVAERERVRKINDEKILGEEAHINTNIIKIQKILKKKIMLSSNNNVNYIFFKNPAIGLSNEGHQHDEDYEIYLLYGTFLFYSTLYIKFSFKFIFFFIRSMIFRAKISANYFSYDFGNIHNIKISLIPHVVSTVRTKVCNLYLFYIFKKHYKISYTVQELKNTTKVLYLPPKKHIKRILNNKQVFFFLKNFILKKQKVFCLKKISSKVIQEYYEMHLFKYFMYNKKHLIRLIFKNSISFFNEVSFDGLRKQQRKLYNVTGYSMHISKKKTKLFGLKKKKLRYL